MPHAILTAVALLIAAPEPSPEPIPLQRPSSVQPPASTPPPPTEATPPSPTEPTPPPPTEPTVPTAELAPAPVETPKPEAAPSPRGRIVGTLTDAEIVGVPVSGIRVVLSCTCLAEDIIEVTDIDGRFIVEELPIGIYTIIADRGGPPTRRVVSLGPGDEEQLAFRVAPPTTTKEIERRRQEAATAHTMIAVGGLSSITGVLMLIGAKVEGAKRSCMFGLDECAAAPRPEVTRGLGVAGGVLLVGGAALVTLGVVRQRRLKASIAVDDRAATLRIVGRF